MRQKRAKAYRKLMHLYSTMFGFRQPYQVLIDSEFCTELHSFSTDPPKQLQNVLQGDVKPMITQCCIQELYKMGRELQPVVDLAKTFERRKCNHREAIPGGECLASVVGDTNKHRYVIATQASQLRATLREIPGVPIIHIHRSVLILEPPSGKTLETKQSIEAEVLLGGPSSSSKGETTQPVKHSRRPKEPNPLSVKKKAVQAQPIPTPSKKRSHSDMVIDGIPNDVIDQHKHILRDFLKKHADFDTSSLVTTQDWSDLADKVSSGGLKKKRKRRRRPEGEEP